MVKLVRKLKGYTPILLQKTELHHKQKKLNIQPTQNEKSKKISHKNES